MKWPPRVQEILNTLATQHPTWVADDSGPAPTPRFRLNEMFAQQVRFEFGPDYGLKRADPGRPISSENLAYQSDRLGGRLLAWAWEDKHDGTVAQFPEGEDITGQVFVSVEPVDHLGSGQPQPSPEPPAPSPLPAPIDLTPVLKEIADLRQQLANTVQAIMKEQRAAVDTIIARQDRVLAGGNRPFSTLKLRPEDPPAPKEA